MPFSIEITDINTFQFRLQQIDLVAWLAQYMESHGFEVDLKDHCGHSPLHLAARAGHASAVAILVAHGADVTAKVFTTSTTYRQQLPDGHS